jgi:hypothetical protein
MGDGLSLRNARSKAVRCAGVPSRPDYVEDVAFSPYASSRVPRIQAQ